MPICANPECGREFSDRIKSAKYCSDKCCRKASNAIASQRRAEAKKLPPPPCARCLEPAKSGNKYCDRCRYEVQKERNRVSGAGIKWNLPYCPWKTEAFCRTWEGRMPNPHIGF